MKIIPLNRSPQIENFEWQDVRTIFGELYGKSTIYRGVEIIKLRDSSHFTVGVAALSSLAVAIRYIDVAADRMAAKQAQPEPQPDIVHG